MGVKGKSVSILLSLWIFLSVLSGGSSALSEATAKYALDPYFGARGVGMGEAFVAVADDAHAILRNPAGLCQVARMQLEVAHYSPFHVASGVKNSFVGFVYPFSKPFSAFGIGYSRLAGPFYSEVTKTLSFSIVPASIMPNISESPFGNVALGISLKHFGAGVDMDDIRKEIGEDYADDPLLMSDSFINANINALDIGLLYHHRREWRMGFAIENVGSPNGSVFGKGSLIGLPRHLRVGVAYTSEIVDDSSNDAFSAVIKDTSSVKGTKTAALEIDHVSLNNGRIDIKGGGEIWFKIQDFEYAEFAVRAGIVLPDFGEPKTMDFGEPKITGGCGVRYAGDGYVGFRADYAFSWLPLDSKLMEHRVSISLILLNDVPGNRTTSDKTSRGGEN